MNRALLTLSATINFLSRIVERFRGVLTRWSRVQISGEAADIWGGYFLLLDPSFFKLKIRN